jgi:hypothetical protein
MTDGEAELRALLGILDPHARDTLRRVLIHDGPTGTPAAHPKSHH